MDYGPLLTVLLASVPLILAAAWLWRRRSLATPSARNPRADALDTLSGWSPQATRVMTVQERVAYVTLRQALPRHMILAQVPLARFIRVPERNSYQEWMRRVGQLCADLVVCDRHSQVIAVVEVRRADNRSERSLKRQRRISRVLEAANIPLHVWIEGRLPTAERAREALLPRLVQSVPGVPMPPTAPTMPARPVAAETAAASESTFVYDLEPPHPDDDMPPDRDPVDSHELHEPPPSTWFDEFDSSPVPLGPAFRPPPSPTERR